MFNLKQTLCLSVIFHHNHRHLVVRITGEVNSYLIMFVLMYCFAFRCLP